MNRLLKYTVLTCLVVSLFLIRALENYLFYDPFILYFKNDYLYARMPNVNILKLVVSLSIRYALNAIITIAVVYLLFEQKQFAKFASIFLMIAFLVLLTLFVFFIRNEFSEGYLLPFYIRRFLIHPVFLLVLVPTFYYQKLNKKTF